MMSNSRSKGKGLLLPKIKIDSQAQGKTMIVREKTDPLYGTSPLMRGHTKSPGVSVSNSFNIDDISKGISNLTLPIKNLVRGIENSLDGISKIDKFYKNVDLDRHHIKKLLHEQYSFFEKRSDENTSFGCKLKTNPSKILSTSGNVTLKDSKWLGESKEIKESEKTLSTKINRLFGDSYQATEGNTRDRSKFKQMIEEYCKNDNKKTSIVPMEASDMEKERDDLRVRLGLMTDLRQKLLSEIEDTFASDKYKNIRESIEEMRVNYIPEQKKKMNILRWKKKNS